MSNKKSQPVGARFIAPPNKTDKSEPKAATQPLATVSSALPQIASTVEQNVKPVVENVMPVVEEAQRVAAQTSVSGRRAVSRGTILFAMYLWLLSGALMLSWFARRTDLFPFDRSITGILQRQRNPWMRRLMLGISEVGFPEMSVPLTFGISGIFWALRFRLEAIFLLFTTSSHLLNALVKRLIKRPRPARETVTVVRVINEPSFPSGHVMHYMNFFGLLTYLIATNWRSGRLRNILITICTAFILLVGPSRVYLGAHWPSDVMAGYLYGGLWFAGLMALYLRVKAWVHPPKGQTPEAMKPLQQPGDDDGE